jgi:hypothetical protein
LHKNKVNNSKVHKMQGMIKYAVLILSILLISFGLYRNELQIVFKKAINICLECIGIG